MPITILCPHCKGELAINPQAGIEKRQADCPQCKKTISISECLPKCSLRVDNDVYQLHFGNQWVGRDVPDSDADILIPDNSSEMSRKHAKISLVCTAKGIDVTIEDHGKNPTEVQGVELVNGDIIFLNPNDAIRMGQVKMYLSSEYGN